MTDFNESKITIDKVTISGFAGIKNKIDVTFDKHTNLIGGPSDAVKQAIASAIDFVLNSSYQSENAVSMFWPMMVSHSFVSVYISSDREFELNEMDAKEFRVTRCLRKDRIGFVFISCEGRKPRPQDIQSFHNQLNLLQFTRIDDVWISERSHPTGCDLNGTFINAMDLTASFDAIKNSSFVGTLNNIRFDNELNIFMSVHKRRGYDAKTHLIELRTLEAAILMNEFDAMNSKNANDSHTARGTHREIDLLLKAQKFENLQRRHFEYYKNALQQISEADASTDFMADINESINEFMVHWKKYTDDMKSARKIQWDYEKDLQLNQMKLNQCIGSSESVQDCEKQINAAQNRILAMHQSVGYKLSKRLADEISKEIEDRCRVVNDEMTKLKAIEQQTFKSTSEFLALTNQLAVALLTFEEFSLRQTLLDPSYIESWRVGFMALTSEMAYAKQIPQEFVGNIFDFIDPNVTDVKLEMVLPLLQQYFAAFFFKTKSAADAFEELVKPLPESGSNVFIHVVTEEDPARLAELPFTSLADYALSEETRAQNPLITNWLHNIRVCTQENTKPALIPRLAIKCKCKIIFDGKCFHEDGHVSHTSNGKSTDTMKALLQSWQLVVTQRDKWLMVRDKKFHLDKTDNEVKMQRNDIKSQINGHLDVIAHGMARLVRNTDMLLNYADLETAQQIQIEVNRMKKELLEGGDATPNIELKDRPQIPQVEASDVHASIEKFETNAWTIAKSFLNEKLIVGIESQPDQLCQIGKSDLPIFQIVHRYDTKKTEIEELQRGLSALEVFDYERQFKALEVQSKEELKEICTETDGNVVTHSQCLKELQANSSKLGAIKQFPKLMDMEKASTLSKSSLKGLRYQKAAALDSVPSDLLLPEFDVDLNVTLMTFDGVETCDLAILNVPIDKIKGSGEVLLVHSYFNSLSHVLNILNEMCDDDVIGFEISSMRGNTFMFHDTNIDKAWCNRFTMQDLFDVCLTFVGKIRDNNETIVTSDLLTVKSHRFYLLLHMTLSIWKNPSVVILNNSIIGHPVESLRKIVQMFQLVSEFDDLVTEPQFASRQIIVVTHSSNYRDLFEHSYKLIECKMQRNKAYVECKDVRAKSTDLEHETQFSLFDSADDS